MLGAVTDAMKYGAQCCMFKGPLVAVQPGRANLLRSTAKRRSTHPHLAALACWAVLLRHCSSWAASLSRAKSS